MGNGLGPQQAACHQTDPGVVDLPSLLAGLGIRRVLLHRRIGEDLAADTDETHALAVEGVGGFRAVLEGLPRLDQAGQLLDRTILETGQG